MKSLVICEKPDQARKISAAVGKKFGEIIPFVGHIARIETPDEENPNWKNWNNDILLPARGYYKTIIVPQHRALVARLKTALASVDNVIIATDFDREGQLIAQEVLEYLNYKGKKQRAEFSALDVKSLQKAFNNLHDNAKFENWYQAGIARQQTDQIFNLTLTRVVSNNLKKSGSSKSAIGIGRVKTPTMGIVCKIEDSIINFKPEEYWTINAEVEGQAGKVTLRHGGIPTSDNFLKTADYAKAVATVASKYAGPINIKKEKKIKPPPQPHDLTSLSNATSAAFGWTAEKTLKIAQALYEKHEITTYPRADCRYLAELMIPEADVILDMLKKIPDYSKYGLISPIIRKGKTGVYWDEIFKEESHHAIVPNVNVMDNEAKFKKIYAGLDAEERGAYDIIARQFLACIGEDMRYDSTEANILINHDAKEHKFISRGQVITFPGFREILKHIEDDDDKENAKIPNFKDQDPVKTIGIKIVSEATKEPARLSEGQLLLEMKAAWKYVDDPDERARLKEAKGIGTAATRGEIIKGLKSQNLLNVVGRKLMPTPGAMEIYYTLRDVAPELLEPGATARMEKILDGIAAGKYTVGQAINDTCQKLKPTVSNILAVAGKVSIDMSAKAMRPAKGKKASGATSTSAAKKQPATSAKPTYAKKPTGSASAPSNTKVDGTLLKVPFEKKDDAKRLGAKWHADAKSWFAPKGVDLAEFKKKGWL